MASAFQALKFTAVQNETFLPIVNQSIESTVTLNDPAIFAMTDFLHTAPICIESTVPISMANERMIAYGIRLLFVQELDRGISGLITYNDVWGERPINYIKEHGGSRDEIIVLDVMTRKAQVDSIKMSDVAMANVGDVVETLKACERHHVLVTEDRRERMVVRGLFSITHVSRLLKEKIELPNRANTFADLEKALIA